MMHAAVFPSKPVTIVLYAAGAVIFTASVQTS